MDLMINVLQTDRWVVSMGEGEGVVCTVIYGLYRYVPL